MTNLTLMSDNINELIAALSKAQGVMSAAAKDCNNPFFNSKYADLSSVWNACRDALSQHGLAVVQTMNKDHEGDMFLTTTLGHSSGQWMRSYLPIKIRVPETPESDKFGKPKKVNELQLLGSCLTYLRRYALAAIVGVAPDEDDDGNLGHGYQADTNKKTQTKTYEQQPTIKRISESEAENLKNILEKCDPNYKEKVIKHIKKEFNASSLSEIPASEYNRVKNAAVINMEETSAKQKEQYKQPELAAQEIQ